MTLTETPSPLAGRLAVLAALVGVVALVFTGPPAILGVAGLLGVLFGTTRGSRPAVTLGVGGTLLGVLLAGAGGASPPALLVATAGAVVAWDLGDHAIGIGRQLGADADVRRADTAHAVGSSLVAVGTVVVGYGTFLASAGGRPVAALLLLLLGAVVLVSLLKL